jgi:hypothetical protein
MHIQASLILIDNIQLKSYLFAFLTKEDPITTHPAPVAHGSQIQFTSLKVPSFTLSTEDCCQKNNNNNNLWLAKENSFAWVFW